MPQVFATCSTSSGVPETPVNLGLNFWAYSCAIAGVSRSGSTLTKTSVNLSASAPSNRLVSAAGFGRRSALAVALATRLVPTLERDGAGLAEAVRGRGIRVDGFRGHARLVAPLVAGSLERAANLGEAMEARGFGRPGHTKAPHPNWGWLDRIAVTGAGILVAAAALWL